MIAELAPPGETSNATGDSDTTDSVAGGGGLSNIACTSNEKDTLHALGEGPMDDRDAASQAMLCPGASHEFAMALTLANYVIAETKYETDAGKLQMRVLDGTGKVLWVSTGGDFAVIHRRLAAGVYRLQIENLTQAPLAYDLRVRALPAGN